ncbi:type II secretion system F family protein [Mycolicibacterium flavescens]|uniref:Pilus assembly protein TadC n=1 Tax=Mycolicibacterium flavescens TaxID=1776 RepID=A0A1E3RG16_MYCFV|nr:type II secretion system F family protein [Mycolicibacterium flavescens]MCV7280847.1 type II secretion system F family protein [Mycolicibacterium flavescens]ODQ88347.1 pilus assembly protein TadC [Mycolicibacterium flavescens]
MSVAALLLACALLVGAPPVRRRLSTGRPAAPPPRKAADPDDPMAFASSLDVLAACLHSGMAVPTAAAATVPTAPPALAAVLARAADLLALGADPQTAWSNPAEPDRHVDALLRLARRSAASGTALAQGITELAERYRDEAADAARAAGERASVLIAGPLGLCYLPAFVCLGVVPVVAGLAGDVLSSGIV